MATESSGRVGGPAPGIDALARWLARFVVDQALAERREQPTKESDDARGDLREVQQREAV